MSAIRTTGLTKDFGGLRAVDNITFELPEEGVRGFVNPFIEKSQGSTIQ